MYLKAIQSEVLCKILSNEGDKKKSGVPKENKLNETLATNTVLHSTGSQDFAWPRHFPSTCTVWWAHFEITLAPARVVIKGSDPTQLAYELTNIQLMYETLHDMALAKEAASTYRRQSIHEGINIFLHSLKGIFMLFCKTRVRGARNLE